LHKEQSRVVRFGDRAGLAYGPERVEIKNSSVWQRRDKREGGPQELILYNIFNIMKFY
jgi:hypothetical protein